MSSEHIIAIVLIIVGLVAAVGGFGGAYGRNGRYGSGLGIILAAVGALIWFTTP